MEVILTKISNDEYINILTLWIEIAFHANP